MGFSIAQSAQNLGANVTLVTGPTQLNDIPGMNIIHIKTSDEMRKSVNDNLDVDYIVMNAAIADYKAENITSGKIKKNNQNFKMQLTPTIDILDNIQSKTNACIIGFALELENKEQNALSKLKKKNLDFIVLNTANDVNQGFDVDTNQVTIFSASGEKYSSEIDTKYRIANFIWEKIID